LNPPPDAAGDPPVNVSARFSSRFPALRNHTAWSELLSEEMEVEPVRSPYQRMALKKLIDCQKLAREFVRLHQKQLETIDRATFLGLTPGGWREYDAREFCIHLFTQELSRLLVLNRAV
jgi:hypothetical protein